MHSYVMQEAQLSQRGRAMLCVVEYNGVTFKIRVRGRLKLFKMVSTVRKLGTVSYAIATMAVSLAIPTQYTNVTGRQTDTTRRHRPCIASRGNKMSWAATYDMDWMVTGPGSQR